MKLLQTILLFAAAALCAGSVEEDLVQVVGSEWADEVEVFGRLLEHKWNQRAELPLPALPEELYLGNVTLPLSFGNLSLIEASLWGLSGLEISELSLTEPAVTLKVRVDVPVLSSNGTYEADLSLLEGLITLAGAGNYDISLTGFSVALSLKLGTGVNGTILISDLDLELSLGTMNTYMEGLEMGGVPIDWTDPETQVQFQGIIEGLLGDLLGSLNGSLEDLLNGILATCSIEALLAGDFTCSGVTEHPELTSPRWPEPELGGQPSLHLSAVLIAILPLCLLSFMA